ncbi:MAG: LptF/LptG family permease, partial [Saprospiraceae bacterium]|nr:LptF/LptG family permease [Saprospiraceae bacterium]
MKRIRILDRYIITTYLKTFFFTAMLFSLIAVVIDFSERLEAFIKSGVNAYEVTMYYYIHFVTFINGMLWPLFALISVIFFTARLAKNSEFISILNAGVGYHRILLPYMGAAGIIFVLHLGINHYMVPLGSKVRIPFENKNVWRTSNQTRTKNIHVMLNPTTKLYIRNYRERDSTALDMRIEY